MQLLAYTCTVHTSSCCSLLDLDFIAGRPLTDGGLTSLSLGPV